MSIWAHGLEFLFTGIFSWLDSGVLENQGGLRLFFFFEEGKGLFIHGHPFLVRLLLPQMQGLISGPQGKSLPATGQVDSTPGLNA
jgi:hypothetical protein